MTLRLVLARVALGCSLTDAIGAALATGALRWTVTMASIWGICTRTIPWRRTSKFRAAPSGRAALRTARAELFVACGLLLLGLSLAAAAPHLGLLLMLAIGLILQGIRYLAAPAFALLAERELRLQGRARDQRLPRRSRAVRLRVHLAAVLALLR